MRCLRKSLIDSLKASEVLPFFGLERESFSDQAFDAWPRLVNTCLPEDRKSLKDFEWAFDSWPRLLSLADFLTELRTRECLNVHSIECQDI